MEAILILRVIEGAALIASLFMKEAPKIVEATRLVGDVLKEKEIKNVQVDSEEFREDSSNPSI
jgi:hypothetical protein